MYLRTDEPLLSSSVGRQHRRKLRKQLVAKISLIASAVALLAILLLLLTSAVTSYRIWLRHPAEEASTVTLELAKDEYVVAYVKSLHQSRRFKRSDTGSHRYVSPSEVTLNAVAEDALLPWKELERFKDVLPLDKIRGDLVTTEGTDHVTVMTNHTYANEFERVEAFCKETIANRSKPDNESSVEEGHGSSSAEEEHDACATERNSGLPALWAILYILIVLFLFIALAIICDDFFVPSLEVISERLNLSEDVAGATFMAAGSSAPELFTSVAGVGTGSDVGVGTIVGSAVFNLLVIIALTSALAGRVLQIDWRPLIRDSIFYGGSVVVFILFSWDGIFMWWESFFLLLLYVLYIVTMKFNQKLMEFLDKAQCCGTTTDGRVSPTFDSPGGESPSPAAETPPANDNNANLSVQQQGTRQAAIPEGQLTIVREQDGCGNGCRCCCCCCCRRMCGCRFTETQTNTGVAEAKLAESNGSCKKDVNEKAGNDLADLILCNECKDAQYLEEDVNENGKASKVEAQCGKMCNTNEKNENQREASCDGPPPYECVRMSNDKNLQRVNSTDKNFRYPNKASPNNHKLGRRQSHSIHIFRRNPRKRRFSRVRSVSVTTNLDESTTILDTNNSTKEEMFVHSEGSNIPPPNLAPPPNNVTTTGDDEATAATVAKTVESAEGGEGGNEEGSSGADNEERLMVFPCLPPIKHAPPEKPDSSHCIPSAKYLGAWFVYALSFPWICAYTWTIPDCSKPENKKWYAMSFLISIVWIALISFVMVEVVDIIGCLMGIDSYTMGLVVIAVGTSVPDALSSVLVAREGFGDMAVSNAIGSNVFDINLGLGLPFLLRSVITSEPVYLLSSLQSCLLDNLTLSVRLIPHVKFGFILLLILFICLILFLVVRFRLNKTIGTIFVTMYFAFMIYAFVQEKSCFGFYC